MLIKNPGQPRSGPPGASNASAGYLRATPQAGRWPSTPPAVRYVGAEPPPKTSRYRRRARRSPMPRVCPFSAPLGKSRSPFLRLLPRNGIGGTLKLDRVEPTDLDFCLERDLGAHRNRIELCAGIAEIGRAHLLGDVAMEIVEHEPDVVIDVPVQRQRIDCLSPASDAVCKGQPIVEIHGAVAAGNFPCAPAATAQGERIGRRHAAV